MGEERGGTKRAGGDVVCPTVCRQKRRLCDDTWLTALSVKVLCMLATITMWRDLFRFRSGSKSIAAIRRCSHNPPSPPPPLFGRVNLRRKNATTYWLCISRGTRQTTPTAATTPGWHQSTNTALSLTYAAGRPSLHLAKSDEATRTLYWSTWSTATSSSLMRRNGHLPTLLKSQFHLPQKKKKKTNGNSTKQVLRICRRRFMHSTRPRNFKMGTGFIHQQQLTWKDRPRSWTPE